MGLAAWLQAFTGRLYLTKRPVNGLFTGGFGGWGAELVAHFLPLLQFVQVAQSGLVLAPGILQTQLGIGRCGRGAGFEARQFQLCQLLPRVLDGRIAALVFQQTGFNAGIHAVRARVVLLQLRELLRIVADGGGLASGL